MIITWHGYGAVKLTEGEVTVAINPHQEKEPKMPRISADLLLMGRKGPLPESIKNDPFIIDKPGEYEAKNVFVYGVESKGEAGDSQTAFIVEIGGIVVGYLGGVKQDELTTAQMEKFEGVDILLIPVGDPSAKLEAGGLSVKQAIKIINQVEPRIVTPIQYQPKDLQSFLKEYGTKSEEGDKLKAVKKDLLIGDTKVFVINPS